MTQRGVNRGLIAIDDADLKALQELVLAAAARFGWECDVYTLMSNHFHLVVPGGLTRLSGGLHWICGLYAQRINRRHNTSSTVLANSRRTECTTSAARAGEPSERQRAKRGSRAASSITSPQRRP